MGQFSYCCDACGHEVLHGVVPGYSRFTEAVVLFANGDRISGEYDGYGRVGPLELVDLDESKFRVLHRPCYTGQSFEDVPSCGLYAPDQGWWPGERLAVERYGEPDLSEIEEEQTYVCYSCRRTWQAKWSGGVCPHGCEQPESDDVLVEPFAYLSYTLGTADGLGICRNEKARDDRPCWARGLVRQVRVETPELWQYEGGGKEYRPVCSTCGDHNIEIVR